MPALPEVQAAFRRALVDADDGALAALVASDSIAAAERIAVHRNNFCWSLTDALRDTFPAVCRLVDERFFTYAAHVFLRRHPPESACLAEYGGRFPGFLAAFAPCRHLVYLADVARLEWLMNAAAHAADAVALAPTALGIVAPEDARRLVFRFDPALSLLASPWPVDRIWRINRPGAGNEETVDLGSGGVHVEIGRDAGDVVLRRLDAASFAFRSSLARGRTLETATAAALTAQPQFDLGAAVASLFVEGAVIAFDLAPETAP